MDEMPDGNENMLMNNDPFYGYASCPDKCRAHIQHSKNNQILWMQDSELIIREFIQKADSFKNFYDAYVFLAHKRHDLAVKLKQKSEEDQTESYGKFRDEENHYRQSITAGDGEHFWKWQKNKIFELTRVLIFPLMTVDINNPEAQFVFEDKYKTSLLEKVIIDGIEATYYCITIKFPHELGMLGISHIENLSMIELYEFDEQRARDLIRIEYAPVNNKYVKNHYQIANYYYKKLFNWQQEESIENFSANAARLFYLMAHLLPIKHGNSAVMEWMLHGLAFRNGLELGYFNLSEGISWDFKAILTPDLEIYIKWYCEKLFTGWIRFDIEHNSRLFTFAPNAMR